MHARDNAHVQEQRGIEPDRNTRRALESAGAKAAVMKVGGILGSFNQQFRERLAGAMFPP